MQTVTTIGLDIAKSVFQVHCVDAVGRNRAISRKSPAEAGPSLGRKRPRRARPSKAQEKN